MLKIGVWARTQMKRAAVFGDEVLRRFEDYEAKREGRRVSARRIPTPHQAIEVADAPRPATG